MFLRYCIPFLGKGKESNPTHASANTSGDASVNASADSGDQLSADALTTLNFIIYDMRWQCVGGVLVTRLGLMELLQC